MSRNIDNKTRRSDHDRHEPFLRTRFLHGLDELQRQVQLEGLAAGFGAGVVFMMSYPLAERAGAPILDASDPLLVMVVFWVGGQWLAMRRFR